MNVFSDLHHSGLYASFHYLFEERLGYNLYRPIGLDWFEQGYWKIAEPYNNNRATVSQFLDLDDIPTDGSPPLNRLRYKDENDIYHIQDANNSFYQKAITLKKFKEMDIDVMIASVPAHIQAYKRLIAETGKKTKLIYQMGNIGWHEHIPWETVDNIMASVAPFPVPAGKNVVFYRQEFDLNIFKPSDSTPEKEISSFVNLLPAPDIFLQLERLLPEYKFYAFGITCRDGICHSTQDIANQMGRSTFGYHFKPLGDGYGHVIHNWAAMGKPIIVGQRDYKDKLAGDLLEDMVTCVDISDRKPEEVAEIVRSMSLNDYQKMCNNVRKRFSEVVSFEKDAENVKAFLDSTV